MYLCKKLLIAQQLIWRNPVMDSCSSAYCKHTSYCLIIGAIRLLDTLNHKGSISYCYIIDRYSQRIDREVTLQIASIMKYHFADLLANNNR